ISGATSLFGWTVTGYVESARAAAAPALMPAVVVDTQNDLATATSLAHQRQRQAADGLDGALAILALVASQALFVTRRERRPPPPLRNWSRDSVRCSRRLTARVDAPRECRPASLPRCSTWARSRGGLSSSLRLRQPGHTPEPGTRRPARPGKCSPAFEIHPRQQARAAAIRQWPDRGWPR